MHRTQIGSIALASAATDDVLAWSLLAVVVAIAGADSQEFRLFLAPVYAVVMFALVRPLLGQARGCIQAAGPAHAQRSRGGAGRAAAVLLRHHLDGPEVHLRRLPFRRRHAPGGGRGRPA
jgi:hypothetical protein